MVQISFRSCAVTYCLVAWSSLSLSKPISHSDSLVLRGGNILRFLTNVVGRESSTEQYGDLSEIGQESSQCIGNWTLRDSDTVDGIAQMLHISSSQLATLNPHIQWDKLISGQIVKVPCENAENVVESSLTTSTTSSSASYIDATASSLTDLKARVWKSSGHRHGSSYQHHLHARRSNLKRDGQYTVASGDTGISIAANNGISFQDLAAANPGVVWTNLQVGQVLNLPGRSSSNNGNNNNNSNGSNGSSPPQSSNGGNTGSQTHQDVYNFYSGSSASDYPSISSWQSFDEMWQANAETIGASCSFAAGTFAPNTDSETSAVKSAIQSVASSTRVNAAYILAMVLQESNGCVRVPTTSSWQGIKNPGLLQTFQGSASCNDNGQVQSPCPDSTILSMIQEGVAGNQNVGIIPGMKTAAQADGQAWPLSSMQKRDSGSRFSGDAMIYYQAARIYNSGSLPADGNLSGESKSTACYVSDIANRLMGWVRAPKTCGA